MRTQERRGLLSTAVDHIPNRRERRAAAREQARGGIPRHNNRRSTPGRRRQYVTGIVVRTEDGRLRLVSVGQYLKPRERRRWLRWKRPERFQLAGITTRLIVHQPHTR